MNICVLCGGDSPEKAISQKSGKAVVEALRELGHNVDVLDGTEETVRQWDASSCDLVFNVLHGGGGENGDIQKILDMKGVAYTGSTAEVSARCADKIISKRCFQEWGVDTPRFVVVSRTNDPAVADVELPCVVKPKDAGSSLGVTLVRERKDLVPALIAALALSAEALVEEYVAGREMTVGLLGDKVLPCVEIIPQKEFFDYEAKYTKGLTRYVCPAPLTDSEWQRITEMAMCVHKNMGCRDFYRLDFILSARGPVMLEVNTIPGFTETSLLPMAAKAVGLSFADLCAAIVQRSGQRIKNKDKGAKIKTYG